MRREKMAAASSSQQSFSWRSSSAAEDPKHDLLKQIKRHEIGIVELNSLSSSRTVYQKNGNILFRTSIQKATASEQRQLDLAKAKLQKLNSA